MTHGVNGDEGVRIGGDPAAREDSTRRMAAFLATHLGGPAAAR